MSFVRNQGLELRTSTVLSAQRSAQDGKNCALLLKDNNKGSCSNDAGFGEWLSARETAQLIGESLRTVQEKIKKEKYAKRRTVTGRGGKRSEVHISCLPEAAQMRWRKSKIDLVEGVDKVDVLAGIDKGEMAIDLSDVHASVYLLFGRGKQFSNSPIQ